jgi:hypothetical protein
MRAQVTVRRFIEGTIVMLAVSATIASTTALTCWAPVGLQPVEPETPREIPSEDLRRLSAELREDAARRTAMLRASDIETLLNAWHVAASKADEAGYFDPIAENGVFMGTDASERWTKEAFREYAKPHFAAGKGWTFRPRDRHIDFSPAVDVAWIDELLDSDHLGVCRGSGALVKSGETWKIVQYNLSIPIPNDLAKDFVGRIREYEKAGAAK